MPRFHAAQFCFLKYLPTAQGAAADESFQSHHQQHPAKTSQSGTKTHTFGQSRFCLYVNNGREVIQSRLIDPREPDLSHVSTNAQSYDGLRICSPDRKPSNPGGRRGELAPRGRRFALTVCFVFSRRERRPGAALYPPGERPFTPSFPLISEVHTEILLWLERPSNQQRLEI